ncbi:hypothetical protein ACFL35_00670 [Candidatus Riflebacteria bacterium]
MFLLFLKPGFAAESPILRSPMFRHAEVVEIKKATLIENRFEADAKSQILEIKGGIGELSLLMYPEKGWGSFKLCIETSHGMEPMLEHFSIENKEVLFQFFPFHGQNYVFVKDKSLPKSIDQNKNLQKNDYLRFEREGNKVIILFLSKARKAFAGTCQIKWIDWYR